MATQENSSGATLTIRFIRSFEYRNIKCIVVKNADLSQTVSQFIAVLQKRIQTEPGVPLPVKKYVYDTLKIQHIPHGSKSSNPVIVMEDDEKLILQPDKTLMECGVVDQTEISFFKNEDYIKYKNNPEIKW